MRVISLFVIGALLGCGAESNINSFFVSDIEESSYETLMETAQAEYDLGNFESAINLSLEAEKKNPEDPDAVILGAFAALGNANLDPVNLAKKLLDLKSEQDKTGVEQNTDDYLASLQAILKITEADLAKMGTKRSESFDGVNYTYYEPKSSEEARSSLSRLSKIKVVLDKLCPYVPQSSKADGDTRYQCAVKNADNSKQTSIQFLWALAHLGETLYFNSVLLYAPEGQTTPSIQAYGEAIANKKYVPSADASSQGDVLGFLTAVTSLSSLVDKIFDVQSGTPMITTLLHDLDTAQLAISVIPSIPAQIRDSISQSSKKINSIRDVLEKAGASGDIGNSAVRTDLLKSTGDKLLGKLSESDIKDKLSVDQKKEACDQIKKLLGLDPGPPIPPTLLKNASECD